MRQSRFEYHTRHLLLALAVGASGTVGFAQETDENGRLKAAPALQEAKKRFGPERIIKRTEYFDLRRRNPADEAFDASLAREVAIEARDRQAATTPAEAPNTGTVWTSIGPAPIMNAQTPQDFQQPSSASGRLTDIAIDPVDFRIYAGGAQGGLWRSDDNGATWTPLTDALGSLATGAVTIDPGNRNVIYYGTGEGNLSGDSYAGVGIYKSTDRGNTWSAVLGNAQFRGRSVTTIAVDRTNSSVVLAGSTSGIFGSGAAAPPAPLPTRGIYKSTDGGTTWTLRASPAGMAADVRASIVLQDPLVATRWYATMSNVDTVSGGLWLSTDNGDTWTSLNGVGGAPTLAVPALGLNRYWLSGTFNTGDALSTLYLGTGHNNLSAARGGRIYKSTDSGATWAQQAAADDYCMGQCFYDMPVWVEPGNKLNVYHGGAGAVDTAGTTKSNIRRSTDGGATFVDIMRCPAPCTANGGVPTAIHSDTHAIMTQPGSGNILWVSGDGGIWRSTDRGTTWQNRNTNLALTQFTGFDVNLASTVNQAYGGTQDNGTMGWTGTGVGWPHLDFGDGGFAEIDQGNPNNLVHTYFNQSNNLVGVGCTTGGFATTQGNYLQSFAPGNGITISDRVLFYAPIHLDNGSGAATSTLYYGTHRIWRASNFFATGCGGGSVFVSLMGGTDLLGGAGSFSAIETQPNAVAGNNADVIVAGSSTGRVFRTVNATAGTPAFTELDTALTPKPYISDVLVDPTIPVVPGTSGTIWVARSGFFGSVTGNQIRRSTDGGATWVTAGNGIPDIPVNAIARDPLVASRLWAGTDIGIYMSSDNGLNWTVWGTGLPNAAVFDLKTSPLPAGQGAILAVTHGRSAWRLTPLTPVSLQEFRVE
jgi:hypothetical protein